MKPGKTSHESQGTIRTVVCILAAVLILLIALPAFAEDETRIGIIPEDGNLSVTEEVTEDGQAEQEPVTENDQEGYVTLKAVSGNISVTD